MSKKNLPNWPPIVVPINCYNGNLAETQDEPGSRRKDVKWLEYLRYMSIFGFLRNISTYGSLRNMSTDIFMNEKMAAIFMNEKMAAISKNISKSRIVSVKLTRFVYIYLTSEQIHQNWEWRNLCNWSFGPFRQTLLLSWLDVT